MKLPVTFHILALYCGAIATTIVALVAESCEDCLVHVEQTIILHLYNALRPCGTTVMGVCVTWISKYIMGFMMHNY
jgi:hypothetical protein